MDITPIRNDRLSDKVVHKIVDMIINGELKPGDKLPSETILAQEFDISRGILREALTILQNQGYIRRKPRDGTYIQENLQTELLNHSITKILKKVAYCELIEFREALELKIVENVIERATQDDLDELFDIINNVPQRGLPANIDYYFHYKLAQNSGNVLFMNFIDTYYDLIEEIAIHSRKNVVRQEEIVHEHTAIVKAIENRDKEAAFEAVRCHISSIKENAQKI